MIGSELEAANGLVSDRLPQLPDKPPTMPVELDRVVVSVLAQVRTPASVTIDSPAGSATGLGSAAELSVALLCLIENAMEALAEPGGTIRIRCRRCDGWAIVEVADDGPGFAESALRAANPVFDTRPGHLGLGLKISRRIAVRSGGSLELDTAEGGGGLAALVIPCGST